MRNAKIVCTLGPASDDRETIARLARAGMSVARLNASHGTIDDRRELIERIQAVDREIDTSLAAMLDTKGPEVRTAPIEGEIGLEAGSEVRFVVGEEATEEEVGLSLPIDAVEPGDQVLLDDGLIETVVEANDDGVVTARVESGGDLGSRKGVNVPGVDLALDVVTESDRADLELAAEMGVDFVAASFVGGAEDVYEVGSVLEEAGANIPIVSKIERADAVENLGEIIEASYGVMVARGDLGVECPMEDVPIVQKRIIRKCRARGTPVITATEMLDSMVASRRPTRAEASDVANAVLDGTDAVMLSGETAIGAHPVRVVEAMDRIVREAEASHEYDELREGRMPTSAEGSRTEALARSARFLARDIDASAVVAVSESGYTAERLAKFRPGVPVVAATPNENVRRKLALTWGVRAQYTNLEDMTADEVIDTAVGATLAVGAAETGDTVVALSGMMTELERANTTNMLKVHVAAETLATGTSVVAKRATGPLHHSADGDLSSVPEGAIVSLPPGFDAEFAGPLNHVRGIVDARPGMTGYPAMVARELGIPMVSGADLSAVESGTTVTVDGERGVIYEGELAGEDRR
ncbi:pyruvate kinase [Natronorarus salvus]|uniref:pyruvate kinase n=1 Tax=Natronorarus salvus TaxID=3117733 RepID=UPI002F269D31